MSSWLTASALTLLVLVALLQPTPSDAAEPPLATYVSTSGIPHLDLADLKARRAGRGWDPGDPRGITDAYREVMTRLVAEIAAVDPDAVFHQGDMVRGYWKRDDDHTGIFGPAGTVPQRKQMVVNAGDTYYGETKAFWRAGGIPLSKFHAGVGDHELGGFAHTGHVGPHTWPYRAHREYVHAWTGNFTDGGRRYALHPTGQHSRTAYAVELPGKVLLVTLDPFHKSPNGIDAKVVGTQLEWFLQVIDAHPNWRVFVQSEIPAIGPNCWHNSSRTLLQNGRAIWNDIIERENVKLYLAGEYHATTAYSLGGSEEPIHLVHGGALIAPYFANWAVIQVYADRTTITLREWHVSPGDSEHQLWALPENPRPARYIAFDTPSSEVVGTMTIASDGTITERSGLLSEGPREGDPACEEPQ